MGKMIIRRLTSKDELWLCDDCGQEGVKDNGKAIRDTHDTMIMWFCYNCVEGFKRTIERNNAL